MNKESTTKYDSEFCGNLPIHLINVIQPYGALVVVDKKTNGIIQASENVFTIFGKQANAVVHTEITNYMSLEMVDIGKANLPQVFNINGRNFLGLYHDYSTYFILEINLESANENIASSFIDVYHELKEAMAALDTAGSIKRVMEIAARELKKASGFDKVMIYKFDENWNGHVMAEEKEPDMEAYLRVTFPASDIPKPARDLYLRNAYRYIPDREYTPVKMFPVINPATNTFLDMSDCNVRGVSTVHLEYLKNMRVSASMSTRIIKDGKLWGLIACHHKTPRKMNYNHCTVFELLSGILSTRIAALALQESNSFNSNLSGIYTSLVEEAYRNSNLVETLLNENSTIMQLFSADGVVINYNGNIMKQGSAPEISDIEDIILWLNTKHIDDVYYTNSLSAEYDYATEFRDVASGLMVIPVDRGKDEYILLFRPEVVHTVNWGGNPEERITFEADMKTYHPRHSFKIWKEQVTGISEPWQNAEVEIAENLKVFVKAFLNGKDYTYKRQ